VQKTSIGRRTRLGLMNLAVAALSRVIVLAAPGSVFLILLKYCLTRVSSMNTGCSRAFTPLSRRYAKTVLAYIKQETRKLVKRKDSPTE
jgi:hypothetical protein